MTLLIAGAVLAIALMIAGLIPMAGCPECEGGSIAVLTKVELPAGGDEITGCTTCNDTTRVTLLKKWTYRFPE